jgi:hypothetical protein
MSDVLATAAIIGAVLGLGMAAIAIIGVIVTVRDPVRRTRAFGFVLMGFSVVAASGAVLLVSRLGDRLPVVAGLPVIGFLLATAFLLRLAASKEFRRYRSSRSG